jgi:hypothetical protein
MLIITIILLPCAALCTFIAYKIFNPRKSEDPMDAIMSWVCAIGVGIVTGLFLGGACIIVVASRDADYKITTIYKNGIDANVTVTTNKSVVAFDNDAIIENKNYKDSLTADIFGITDAAEAVDDKEMDDGTLVLTKNKAKLSKSLDTVIVNGPLKNAKVERIEYGTRKLTYKIFGSIIYDTTTETIARVTTAHTGDYGDLDKLLNK